MNLLQHKKGRNLAAFAFYFAEGAPIGFIWWAMPTLLRKSGADVAEIGSFTAILILPWVFKFLWAPLIDVFRSSRFGFKKWIFLSQSLMCLSLLPLIFIPLEDNYFIWMFLLFLHSIFAATQDVSVDALVINITAPTEKGLLNGFMQAGMLLGRSLYGGGILIISQQIGLSVSVALLIISILIIMLLLFFIKDPPIPTADEAKFTSFKTNITEAFTSNRTWYSIAFAFTAAAAFEAGGAFAGPLLTDYKMPQQTIGFFFAVPVVICMLLGGITGGFLSDKYGRKKMLTFFIPGFVIMVMLVALFGIRNPGIPETGWMIMYSGMYFFAGMFTAASYALFMDVTNPKLGATQFSTFMSATNGCEAWVVYSAGIIAAASDYNIAFLVMCMVSLSALLFLRKI